MLKPSLCMLTIKTLYICLYTDIDYCSNEAESVCPNTLVCVTEPKGRYSCEPKLSAKTTQEQLVTIDTIHVVLSVDKDEFPGVLPLHLSMKQHNRNKKLVVHIVVNSQDEKELAKLLTCGFQNPSNFKVSMNRIHGIIISLLAVNSVDEYC